VINFILTFDKTALRRKFGSKNKMIIPGQYVRISKQVMVDYFSLVSQRWPGERLEKITKNSS
jgi:hypothetical protein